MKRLMKFGAVAATMLFSAGAAHAWLLQGNVRCADWSPVIGATVRVVSTDPNMPFNVTAVTDSTGRYTIHLPEQPACYHETLEGVNGGNGGYLEPVAAYYDFCTKDATTIERNWAIICPPPPPPPPGKEGKCWMTGGGQVQIRTGLHSYGGNVNPGCSPTAGEGGNWNHIAHGLNLHFQGRAIQVIRCGNVEGIPAGSTSPKTPYNFIEFTGTGRLVGINGNKASYPKVYFFGRVEDRAEPGSKGQRAVDAKDRYFLQVYSNPANPAGSTLLLVDQDGNPNTVDPVAVLNGNLQIHVTGCAKPRNASGSQSGDLDLSASSNVAEGRAWLGAVTPNPVATHAIFNFALPRATGVTLHVYDIGGRLASDIADDVMSAGSHSVDWDLRDDAGIKVSPGIYFVRLTVEGQTLSRTISVR